VLNSLEKTQLDSNRLLSVGVVIIGVLIIAFGKVTGTPKKMLNS
jgi:hypothetical protein